MKLEELERDGKRLRTGHCRENMSRAGRRLKDKYSGKKVYSREMKWRKQRWSAAKVVLFGKFGKIVK